MGNSKTEFDDDDDSATISDGSNTKTDSDPETETDDEVPPVPPPSSSLFEDGEKVLAFHQKQIYEAKVVKVEYRFREWRYYVHYLGWNKSWDEWVGVDRLLKFDEENVLKQQALNKKQGAEKNTKSIRATQIKPKSSSVARGKKRKNDFLNKDKGAIPMEKLINLQIPAALKNQLVDDCESINHLGKLVKLPRKPNVDDILKKYVNHRLKKYDLIAESVEEIMNGLRCYFNKALPVMLLYKSERQQYVDATRENVSPSSVYGAEHLLRLFVKLPELLAYANIEEETLMELQQKLVDFLKFLQKNQGTFFLATYHALEDAGTSTNR
ncbi:hypothetical protein K2173_026160 [Erythroxylum novogranatense]|uniref:Uncharacterized protein n=1 Tax=Erythroxylum novogranatense TaxID=1862640 RepID=A0AAV8TBD9_9ROSI|nr:hypothetical protein K2173_026160 [Erythroxylum novogranatense]